MSKDLFDLATKQIHLEVGNNMTTSFYRTTVICWVILFVLSTLIVAKRTSNAETSRCPCKYHSAVAQGAGTCSRSEDRSRCTIEFSATNQEEYMKFLNKLQKIGLREDPRGSIYFANKYSPERWDVNFVTEKLPVLFAISQQFGFEDKILITKKILEAKATKILKALQDPSRKEGAKMLFEGFQLNIGYGCIEMHRADFSSMVKTPWSKADFYCDFSTPSWFK